MLCCCISSIFSWKDKKKINLWEFFLCVLSKWSCVILLENADFCEKFGASVANCTLSNDDAIFPFTKCYAQSWQHCEGQFLLTSSSDSKESQSLHWTSFYSHFFTKLQKRENEVFFLIVKKKVGFFSTSFHSFSTWTWDRIIFCFSIFNSRKFDTCKT